MLITMYATAQCLKAHRCSALCAGDELSVMLRMLTTLAILLSIILRANFENIEINKKTIYVFLLVIYELC